MTLTSIQYHELLNVKDTNQELFVKLYEEYYTQGYCAAFAWALYHILGYDVRFATYKDGANPFDCHYYCVSQCGRYMIDARGIAPVGPPFTRQRGVLSEEGVEDIIELQGDIRSQEDINLAADIIVENPEKFKVEY
jgi:hypothetical protein